MVARVYAHRHNCGKDICKSDTHIRVKDIEKIKELRNKFVKYGVVFEEESPDKLETQLHIIIKIPYKNEIIDKE